MKRISKNRIFTDELRTLAWGTDGSCYRLIPEKVFLTKGEEEIIQILNEARESGKSVTFRAAGTSLSGQSITDSILAVAGKEWEEWSVNEDASVISLQPGIIGSDVNKILTKYGKRFGPDPASVASCMVGGIIVNNASGMSCGIKENSDALIVGARLILSDGTLLDTSDEESRKTFTASHPEFIKGIESIRDEVLADKELCERIRYKYAIKNVTGLNLLPLVLYTDPFEIITHLIVGSEGTLAFLSEAKMKTLPVERFSKSAMVYFKDIKEAARSVVALQALDINAAEMLDSRSLASVHDTTGENLTAILLRVQSSDKEQIEEKIAAIDNVLKEFELFCPYEFTDNVEKVKKYWDIRSGIFPTVGGMRADGTTCLIEDIAFHIEDLPEATADLSQLLDDFGYTDSCIYGHALAGNFHFIINQSFETAEEIQRYDRMIHAVTKMVVEKYDGSLKAEHGTGRNMAPFVKYEWGEKAYGIMKKVKALFDPLNILNPGVIFNDDPQCHLKNFKDMRSLVAPEDAPDEAKEAYGRISKCIECGFCEVNCLTCGFTLSSRTRIVAQREIQRLKASGENPSRLKALEKQYGYLGEQSCAGDGLCSRSCPMGISVADLTHEIRRETISSPEKAVWTFAAGHYSGVKDMIRGTLALANFGHSVLGSKAMSAVCKGLHAAGMPLWTPSYPKNYRAPKEAIAAALESGDTSGHARNKVVYFPSCLNQMMGQAKKSPYDKPLVEETIELLNKAGYDVIFPADKDKLCCGTVWESKGMPDIAEKKVRELENALWEASEHGKYPVLCDQSPCLHRMRNCITSMKLYEPAEFIMKFLKDRLEWHKTDETVVIHQTCTMRLMGLDGTIAELARLCTDKVVIPEGVGCCGFAGDKGMTNPEINAYALRKLRKQVEASGAPVGYSNSRTCEIGLQTNSGIPYVSIVFLVNKCTVAKK